MDNQIFYEKKLKEIKNKYKAKIEIINENYMEEIKKLNQNYDEIIKSKDKIIENIKTDNLKLKNIINNYKLKIETFKLRSKKEEIHPDKIELKNTLKYYENLLNKYIKENEIQNNKIEELNYILFKNDLDTTIKKHEKLSLDNKSSINNFFNIENNFLVNIKDKSKKIFNKFYIFN